MIRLGILGCADIAYNRFLPAAMNVSGLKAVAISSQNNKNKLKMFCEKYDLKPYESYDELINSPDLDAVYIPQPPAFHYKYAQKALMVGKHVIVEKPSTTCYEESLELVKLAREKRLALHENYMFQYHKQIEEIRSIIDSGEIGEIRLFRSSFGFPLRESSDFRYVKDLGGGALLDAGGYPIKLASLFLGNSVKVDSSNMNYLNGFEVDMYGSFSLSNDEGVVFQAAYGMDNSYQCKFEVWGSKGRITADRIFTAPDGLEPILKIEKKEGNFEKKLSSDSHFKKSIEVFLNEIEDSEIREKMYISIEKQAFLANEIKENARRKISQ